MLGLERVAQGQALVDFVVGSAPLAGSHDDAGLLQLAQDSLDGTLGDADCLRDLTDPNVRVAHDANQHMPVITEESPCRAALGVAWYSYDFFYIKQIQVLTSLYLISCYQYHE